MVAASVGTVACMLVGNVARTVACLLVSTVAETVACVLVGIVECSFETAELELVAGLGETGQVSGLEVGNQDRVEELEFEIYYQDMAEELEFDERTSDIDNTSTN